MPDFTNTSNALGRDVEGFNDTIIGDANAGPLAKHDQSDLVLGIANLVYDSTQTPNLAITSDRAFYKNVAQKPDGTKVSAALTLVSKSNQNLTVSLAGGLSNEVLLNIFNDPTLEGTCATFTLEFFLPNHGDPLTGDAVTLSSLAAMKHIDDIKSHLRTAETIKQTNPPYTSIIKPKNFTDIKARFQTPPSDLAPMEFTLEARAESCSFSLSGLALPRGQAITHVDKIALRRT